MFDAIRSIRLIELQFVCNIVLMELGKLDEVAGEGRLSPATMQTNQGFASCRI